MTKLQLLSEMTPDQQKHVKAMQSVLLCHMVRLVKQVYTQDPLGLTLPQEALNDTEANYRLVMKLDPNTGSIELDVITKQEMADEQNIPSDN